MKKISFWAKKHIWQARLLVIACHIMLNATGIITGILLNELDFELSPAALPVFVLILFISLIAYPVKNQQHDCVARNLSYSRRKICDFIMAASTFLMITYTSNHFKLPAQNIVLYAASNNLSSHPSDTTIKTFKKITDFSASLKDENGKTLKWKERKKILKQQIKGIKQASDISKGGKILLTILSVLAALGLLYVVAALACGLACNGADAAAWLVLIGGTAVVIFLMVIVMRAIYSNRKARRKLEGMPSQQ